MPGGEKWRNIQAILNNFMVFFTCKGNKSTFPIYPGLENVTYVFFLKTLVGGLFNGPKDESELKTQQLEKSYKMNIKLKCSHNCGYDYKMKAKVQTDLERKYENDALN